MRTSREIPLVLAVLAASLVVALVGGCGDAGERVGNLTPVTAPPGFDRDPASTATTGRPPLSLAAQGRAIFVQTCQGCHPAAGTREGTGPRLAGRGLLAGEIAEQVRNGGGGMPGGLLAGGRLDRVVRYVAGLQGGARPGPPRSQAGDDGDDDDDRGRGRGRGRGGEDEREDDD